MVINYFLIALHYQALRKYLQLGRKVTVLGEADDISHLPQQCQTWDTSYSHVCSKPCLYLARRCCRVSLFPRKKNLINSSECTFLLLYCFKTNASPCGFTSTPLLNVLYRKSGWKVRSQHFVTLSFTWILYCQVIHLLPFVFLGDAMINSFTFHRSSDCCWEWQSNTFSRLFQVFKLCLIS